ncbi:hypothetical protein ACQPZZ_06970 [Microbispora sp. CA-135349]|uniref:hypothetical protein n=1 Tax=Microbispora sp. CA-135349 TaxID=3239953 RepID=UPI003D906326
MRDLPGFDAFAVDQAKPLARTALSLTGDPAAARALVVTALAAVAAKWSTARWSFPAHAARQAMYRAYLKRSRARGSTRGPGPHAIVTHGTDTAALAQALTGLTPRRRALVVACFHDGHTTGQAADLCRMDAPTAGTEIVLAVAELRNRLPASFVSGTAREAGQSPSAPENEDADTNNPNATDADTSGADTSRADTSRADTSRADTSGPDTNSADTNRADTSGPETSGAATDPSPAPGASPAVAARSSHAPWASPSEAGPQSSWASPSEAATQSPWAAPSEAAAPSRVPWISPHEMSPAAGPSAEPAAFALASGRTAPYHATPSFGPPEAAPAAAPFAVSASPAFPGARTGADGRGDGPWEAALRRELAALSAATPAPDPLPLAAEAARTGRQHGTRRRAVVTGMSVTLAALVVVPLAFAAAGLAGRVGRSTAGTPGAPDMSAASPAPLPASLPAPVRFAYQGYCTRRDWDPVTEEFADGCDQWRVVTTTGEQWRLADPVPDLSDGWQPLVAISRDGDRMAFFSEASSDFAVFDRHDTTAKRTGMVPLLDEVSPEDIHLALSPNGRWMAADFGPDAGAVSPRVQNLTSYRVRTLPRRMRVLAVADDGTVTGTATWDTNAVPGRVSTTVLLRVRPDGRTLSRAPIDPALFEAGAAVSPDGRAVAVTAERSHPAEGDHGLLVTLDSVTGRVLTRREAALPEGAHIIGVRGWAGDHEVIVEAARPGEDDDEDYSVHAVDVRTGAARQINLDEAGGVPGLWAPGALR